MRRCGLLLGQFNYNIKGLVGSEMKWNLAVNEPFKNLKEYASLQGQSLALSTQERGGKEEAGQTREQENADEDQAELQVWRPSCNQKWELSFQKYFLAEHTATFKESLWNFKEYGLPILPPQNAQSFLAAPALFQQPEQPLPLRSFLASDACPIPHMHLEEFARAQPPQDDLERFFAVLLSECRPQLAGQLIALALQIWIQFRGLEFRFLERKELLEKARLWADGKSGPLCARAVGSPSEPQHHSPEIIGDRCPILPHVLLFLRYFATTVLFILAGYFENPYSDLSFDFESESQPSHPKRLLPFSPLNLSPAQSGYSSQESEFSACRKQQKRA